MNATSTILVGLCLLCVSTLALAQTSQSYLEGIKALEAKDHVKARPLLMKALEEGANKEETWYALGFVGQYAQDFRLMIDAGKKVAELNPQRRDGWYLMSTGFFQSGIMDSVAIPARKLVEVDRDLAERSNMIRILKSLGQDEAGRRDSVFSSPDGALRISLPSSWSVKHIDDGKAKQMFISLEPVVADTDMFSTGTTIRWIRPIGEMFPSLKGASDRAALITFWRGYEAGMMGGFKPHSRKVQDTSAITIGDWSGEMTTQQLQLYAEAYELTKFDAILARKDEILTVTLECPSKYWPVYRQRFEKALRGMVPPK
jgi:tetratricopeptide (TPR) repeat protein